MKQRVAVLIIVILLSACSTEEDTIAGPGASDVNLVINEVLSTGSPDWLEIYNPGTETVDLSGFYLYDEGSASDKSLFPEGTAIPAGGFLVWDCDDVQTNFKLSSGGEIVTLEDTQQRVIDTVDFPALNDGVSWARVPDGSDSWSELTDPTPGASNTEEPDGSPVIADVSWSPDPVPPGEVVTISTTVTDPSRALTQVRLYYAQTMEPELNKVMDADGDVWSAQIGPFSDGAELVFHITAEDDQGNSAASDTYTFTVGIELPALVINEFLASNDTACQDENGEYDDFFELYNFGDSAIDIGGWFVTDDLGTLQKWQIPEGQPDETTIQPGGFLVIWADEQTEQGALHIDFKLSAGGEDIGLTMPEGTQIVDSLTYDAQTTDVSYGRLPDGSDNWTFFDDPTPGATNQ